MIIGRVILWVEIILFEIKFELKNIA